MPIALVQLGLPWDILIPAGQEFTNLQTTVDLTGHGEVVAVVLPPYRMKGTADAPEPGHGQMEPADPQPIDDSTVIGDSVKVVRCNAIAVNVRSETEFDRRSGGEGAETDAIVAAACAAVNGVLGRMRVLLRSTHLHPIDPESAIFRVVYLNDDGSLVPSEEGKFRASGNVHMRIRHLAITPELWDAVTSLGEYEVPPWEALLLDAQDLDTELGPTLVLAAAAVETRIATALTSLAHSKGLSSLWEWIADRGGDFAKEPSIAEQLDMLLKEFGGRSLKDAPRLWGLGKNLRDGRNSFVHEGRALYGKNRDQPVTRAKARELAAAAGEIIDYIEALLPESERRPTSDLGRFTVTTTLPFVPVSPRGDGHNSR